MTLAFLIDCLWQGALVTMVAAIIARFARSASTRYAVWFLALCALVAIPAFTLFVPLHLPSLFTNDRGGSVGRIRMTIVSVASAQAAPAIWGWILAAWMGGAFAMLVRLGASAARIERVRRKATPWIVGSEAVLASDDVATPVAAGVFAPVVIVPRTLLDRLPQADLERIIAHERAHIARGDIGANYLQRLIEAVLFFNPFVHVIGHRLVNEREVACDDLAVVRTGETHDYAACLAALAQTIAHRSTPVVSPSVFGSRRTLVHRIERLLADDAFRSTKPNYYTVALTLVAFAIAAFAVKPYASALAAPAATNGSVVASASCARPNTDVAITNPAPPDLPKGAHPKRPTLLKVTITPSGVVSRVDMVQSSGDWKADTAAAQAATHSTYTVATRNCKAVAGTYLFRVEYAPDDQLPN